MKDKLYDIAKAVLDRTEVQPTTYVISVMIRPDGAEITVRDFSRDGSAFAGMCGLHLPRTVTQWKPFNVNQRVRVKLTETGRTYLRQQYKAKNAQVRAMCPRVTDDPYTMPEEHDGWSEWSFWSLMGTFGSVTYLGGPTYFEPTVEFAIKRPETL